MDRKERAVREATCSVGLMEATDSIVNPDNAEDARKGLSIGPNKMPPLQMDPERLTGFLDLHKKKRNYET